MMLKQIERLARWRFSLPLVRSMTTTPPPSSSLPGLGHLEERIHNIKHKLSQFQLTPPQQRKLESIQVDLNQLLALSQSMHMQHQVPPPTPGVSGTPSLISGLNNGVTEEPNCEMKEAETGEPTIYCRLGCLDVRDTNGTDPLEVLCKWFVIPPQGVNVDANAPLSSAFHEPPKGRDEMEYTPVGMGTHIFLISDVEYTCDDVPIRRVHYLNTQSKEKKWVDGPTLEKAPDQCYIFAVDSKIYALGVHGGILFTLHYLDYHKLEEGWACLLAKERDDYGKFISLDMVAHTIEYEVVTDSTTSESMRCARRAIIITYEDVISYDFKRNEIDVNQNASECFDFYTSGVCQYGFMYLLRKGFSRTKGSLIRVACFDIENSRWCLPVKGFEEYDNALPRLRPRLRPDPFEEDPSPNPLGDPFTDICQTPSLFLHLGDDRFCVLWVGDGSNVHCTRFTLTLKGDRVFAEKVSTQVYTVEGFVWCSSEQFMALAI